MTEAGLDGIIHLNLERSRFPHYDAQNRDRNRLALHRHRGYSQCLRLPQTRPYRWGFYVGCMGLACAPFALLFIWRIAISAANNQAGRVGEFIGHTVYYSFQSICGWFIIKRRR